MLADCQSRKKQRRDRGQSRSDTGYRRGRQSGENPISVSARKKWKTYAGGLRQCRAALFFGSPPACQHGAARKSVREEFPPGEVPDLEVCRIHRASQRPDRERAEDVESHRPEEKCQPALVVRCADLR